MPESSSSLKPDSLPLNGALQRRSSFAACSETSGVRDFVPSLKSSLVRQRPDPSRYEQKNGNHRRCLRSRDRSSCLRPSAGLSTTGQSHLRCGRNSRRIEYRMGNRGVGGVQTPDLGNAHVGWFRVCSLNSGNRCVVGVSRRNTGKTCRRASAHLLDDFDRVDDDVSHARRTFPGVLPKANRPAEGLRLARGNRTFPGRKTRMTDIIQSAVHRRISRNVSNLTSPFLAAPASDGARRTTVSINSDELKLIESTL